MTTEQMPLAAVHALADLGTQAKQSSFCSDMRGTSLAVLAVLGTFAIVVQLLFLLFLPGRWARNENTDYSYFYEPVAHNLAQGKGFVNSDGSPAVRFPPGYSLLLAGLFKAVGQNKYLEPMALRLATEFVVLITPIFVFAIAGLTFDGGVSFMAALLSSTYPFYLWLTKQPNSEIPFLVFFLPAVYLFMKSLQATQPNWSRGLAVGALLGLASLTRPIAICLSGALVAGIWLCGPDWTRRAKILFSCIVVFGNVAAVFPWEVLAHEKTGTWILLSTGGPPGIVDGLTFAVNNNASSNTLFVSADVRKFMQETYAQKEYLESISAIARHLESQVLIQPATMMKLFALKMARSWYANDRQSLEQWILLLQVPYLSLAAAGIYAAVRMGTKQRRFTFFIVAIIVYFWAMTIVSLSVLRYMVPAMLLLMPFASLGLVTAADTIRARAQIAAFDVRTHTGIE